jgi:CheY-like chemotaxis protein/carbonic anhydrase/acetyltransferase-like protein (isoleucine patch superfamily)
MDVLVVDDDEDLRAFLVAALTEAGYTVADVADGPDATEVLIGNQVGMVILDKELLTVSGLSMLDEWRSSGLTVPVVLLTADQDEAMRTAGLALGANDYLLKPVNLGNLFAVVGEHLGELQTADVPGRSPLESFDFGGGPIPARRHVNPDGSLGGWVAETADVEVGCTVAAGARIFGNARVFGNSLILGSAVVCDFARVRDGGIVTDQARVCESADVEGAVICDQAIVNGRAFVGSTARVKDRAKVTDDARVSRAAVVAGDAVVGGREWVSNGVLVT